MSASRRVLPEARRRGWCPSLARPMQTGDGLLARVHPPLGRLSSDQLRAVAQGARAFGNGHVDVTARANLQIRGVTEASAAPLAALLAAAGLGDRRSDGGPQRLTLTSPLAGLDPDTPLDVLSLADAIETAALAIPGLPPKTLVAVAGPGVDGEGADLVLRLEAGAHGQWGTASLSDPHPHPEVLGRSGGLEGGFQMPQRSLESSFEAARAAPRIESGTGSQDERVRGTTEDRSVSDQFRAGSRSGGSVTIHLAGGGDEILVLPITAAATVVAMLRSFVATGQRRMRDLATDERRAVLQVNDDDARAPSPLPSAGEGACGAGGRGERRILTGRSPLSTLADARATLPRRGEREGGVAEEAVLGLDVGPMPLGPYTILAVEAPFGRCTAQGLERLAETAEALGCAEIRLSPSRGFVLACPDRVTTASGLAALAADGFVTEPDDPRRAVAACPGAPACASGSTPVSGDAERLARAFAPFAARGLSAHVSGCAKGCAHPAPAALTLVGEAGQYRVVLGGAPGEASGPLEAFESVLERVSTADPACPLDQAFRQ